MSVKSGVAPYSNRGLGGRKSTIPYGLSLDCSIGTCSIDGLRLKFTYRNKAYSWEKHVPVPAIDRISALLDSLDIVDMGSGFDVSWSYKDFFKIGAYCRTARISGGDWSCAVMVGRYCFDLDCKQVAPEAVFDYNPNKVPAAVASRIVRLLRDSALSVSVVRFDVAFDIPVPRSDVVLVRDARRGYRLFEDHGAKTEYQGERGSHGAMKLYDKMLEAGLSEPLTRCEITMEYSRYSTVSTLFPKLYSFTDYQLDVAFASLPFQVQACVYHPDLLPVLKLSMERHAYKKYVAMIDAMEQCVLIPDDFLSIDRFVHSALNTYLSGVAL